MADINVNESVKLRLYAAARSAAGRSEITVEPGILANILINVAKGNSRLAHVFLQCSFLLDGVAVHESTKEIPANSTIDVLPPFAGG